VSWFSKIEIITIIMYCIFPVSNNSICFVRLMIKKMPESQCYGSCFMRIINLPCIPDALHSRTERQVLRSQKQQTVYRKEKLPTDQTAEES